MEFRGKTALVTGGTGHIGRAVVKRLLQAGLSVAWTYHSNQVVADEMVAMGDPGKVMAIRTGENNLADARRIVKQVKDAWETVDYLINSIGVTCDRTFVRMEEEDWQTVMKLNLDVPFAFAKAVIFDQLKSQMGTIVNISSVAGLTGSAGQANYSAAKAGLIGLTKSLAREAGRFGVRVNAVAPGYISSSMTDQMPEKYKQAALAMIPLQRFGSSDEVAAAVAFLLSEESRYIQGQVLVVDGGMVAY